MLKTNSADTKSAKTETVQPQEPQDKFSKLDFEIPEIKEFLKDGVQFGHQVSRWNPKMKKFIYTQRGNIHIIDISKTYENLQKALLALVNASSNGDILFVGTKRQARDIIRTSAIDAGAYFVTHRWVGGLLTNFNYTDRSLKKLSKLEQAFETGVEGRTKFEVSLMKKEWERLNRLYEGVKTLNRRPSAIVILDSKYEKSAVREARILGIPIISIVDTNSDPEQVNYPIPGNDDALAAIKLYFDLFGKAVKQGNGGKGIRHSFKDYSKVEVSIKRILVAQEEESKEIESIKSKTVQRVEEKEPAVKRVVGEGILESMQKAKERAKTVEPKKESAKVKETTKVKEEKKLGKVKKPAVKKAKPAKAPKKEPKKAKSVKKSKK